MNIYLDFELIDSDESWIMVKVTDGKNVSVELGEVDHAFRGWRNLARKAIKEREALGEYLDTAQLQLLEDALKRFK